MGCSLGLTDVPDPSTIVDPNLVQTQEGAIGLYRGSVTSFATVFAGTVTPFGPSFLQRGYSVALVDGFAGDQFTTDYYDGTGEYFMTREVDPQSGHNIAQPYSDLHTTRLNIDQAIGALRQYATTAPSSYLAELYALKGYIYVFFGELYCSGVPFSKAIYGGDIELGSPETTTQMFDDAVALFDTALTIATDSARIRGLAYVGKARALVDLGKFSDAATVVTPSNVPTDFAYQLTYSAQALPNYMGPEVGGTGFSAGQIVEADRAGSNGLAYVEAGDTTGGRMADPRVEWFGVTAPFTGAVYLVPSKYPTSSTPVALADGIEARLIEAEAALQANDISTWTDILNTLRETAITPAIPDLTADSTTTASDTLRQNVMFRERAFWLYGAGHRLGDMRRLVRQYHRPLSSVFPKGKVVPNDQSNTLFYSNRPNLAPPAAEIDKNPNYGGCLDRDP
jgi:hypothetical protein